LSFELAAYLIAKFQVGQWRIDPDLNSLSSNGTTLRVEPKVMEVLVCLAAQPGEAVSKETILKTVWPETFVSDDVLIRSISELRRTLRDDAREPRFIETIPKRGYRLIAAVERLNGSAQHTSSSASLASRDNETPSVRRRPFPRWWVVSLAALLLAIGLLLVLNPRGVRDRLLGSKPPTIHSLAVLPLESLSDDPKQEYFAEGVTDALITDLAQISALRVVSRTTIMRYGKPDKPLSRIARELNVDGIVEGTVQRSGDRVRITAQLIYGPADQHLWANSFERDVKDVLDLQSTVANEIASQIKVKVTPEEQARFKNLRPINPKALDAYLEARYHIDQCQNLAFYRNKTQTIREEARKATSFLDEAVREDPNYVPAYVAYFDVIDHVDIPLQGYSSKVHAALSKALELDETNVPTHLALAKLLMEYDYNWAGAEKEYKRAVEIDPRSADAHAAYAEYLDNVEGLTDSGGDRPDAKRERDLAQALDPVHDYLADAAQERMGHTLDEERQAVEQKAPNDPFSLAVMAKDYAIAGRFKDAVEMYERCLTLYGWHDMAAVMKRANAQGGPRYALEEWMGAGEEYENKHGDMPVVPMAFTYASLGNRDRAFAWLDKAVEQRNWMIIYLKRDKVWDPLRSDPRFAALLRRVELP
jgi:TolB-like protein/DNA-binding winged helix-turn-helix (wHTH) protein